MTAIEDHKLLVVARILLAGLVIVVTSLVSFSQLVSSSAVLPGTLTQFGQIWQVLLWAASVAVVINILMLSQNLRLVELLWASTLLGSIVIIVFLTGWDQGVVNLLFMAGALLWGIDRGISRLARGAA